jgi:hypothetical protein
MNANKRQVGGDHYRKGRNGVQHWDLAAAQDYDYFQGQITKYVDRWKRKNGIVDLEKALHFLEKYIEVEKHKLEDKGKREDGMKHPFGYDADYELGN